LSIEVKNSAKLTLLGFITTAVFLQWRNGVEKLRSWSEIVQLVCLLG